MSSPEAARLSPPLEFASAKVKMEASESFDSQKTNSSISTVANSTFRNTLIKSENLTATKLTTIFANSAATSQPLTKVSQINPSVSTSPNTNSNKRISINTETNTNTNEIPIQNIHRGRTIAKEPAGPQLPPKHHLKIQPSTHKYTKIQPQIAPKPIAVLPKRSNFSPIPNPNVKTSLMMSAPATSDKTSLNINTSKRWVLPPRPRPGRKPTASSETDDKSKTVAVAKVSPKKRPKIKKEAVEKHVVGIVNGVPVSKSIISGTARNNSSTSHSGPSTLSSASINSAKVNPHDSHHEVIDAKPGVSSDVDKMQIHAQLQQQYPQESNDRASSPLSTTSLSIPSSVSSSPTNKYPPLANGPSSVPTSSSSASPLSSQFPLPPIVSKNDPKSEIANLKMSYLSKLKEQELIRNYIEVITNQIKELSFVQNGMITFDALRTNSTSTGKSKRVNSPSTMSKSSSYDQLESISNLNDLNKFLNYFAKSSSIIHSATKRSSASSQSSPDTVINSQIDHYLEIRSKFKSMKTEELKRLNNLRKQKNSINGVFPTSVVAGTSLSSNGDLASTGRSSFTPDLLKPLKASNLFDPDGNEDIVIDILGEDSTIGGNLISADNNALTNEDIDIFMEENDFLSRLILNDDVDTVGIPPNADLLKEQESSLRVKIHDKNEPVVQDSLIKKKSKLNCGFCTNDTPCLCFDADFDIGILRH